MKSYTLTLTVPSVDGDHSFSVKIDATSRAEAIRLFEERLHVVPIPRPESPSLWQEFLTRWQIEFGVDID